MYLISAYFDKNTTEKLQEYICKIAEASGNSFMLDNNVPPHMTLTAIEARSIDVLVPTFENLNNKLHGGDISIISVGQFMPKVIYAAPYLNQYLFNLQQDICEAFADIPETAISNYYKPLSWLPHITLAKTLNKEPGSYLKDILKDIERKIVYNSIDNTKESIIKYIKDNY